LSGKRILTVTYGTFSCTLEGFDDAFDTMKAIAEYFRDLSAQDRYFGAVPPQPDPEMLREIAERESRRRIEARHEGEGMVLRPQGPGAEAVPASGAATAPAAAPASPQPASGETVAARLARIRALVASQRNHRAEPQGSIFSDDEGDEDEDARALPALTAGEAPRATGEGGDAELRGDEAPAAPLDGEAAGSAEAAEARAPQEIEDAPEASMPEPVEHPFEPWAEPASGADASPDWAETPEHQEPAADAAAPETAAPFVETAEAPAAETGDLWPAAEAAAPEPEESLRQAAADADAAPDQAEAPEPQEPAADAAAPETAAPFVEAAEAPAAETGDLWVDAEAAAAEPEESWHEAAADADAAPDQAEAPEPQEPAADAAAPETAAPFVETAEAPAADTGDLWVDAEAAAPEPEESWREAAADADAAPGWAEAPAPQEPAADAEAPETAAPFVEAAEPEPAGDGAARADDHDAAPAAAGPRPVDAAALARAAAAMAAAWTSAGSRADDDAEAAEGDGSRAASGADATGEPAGDAPVQPAETPDEAPAAAPGTGNGTGHAGNRISMFPQTRPAWAREGEGPLHRPRSHVDRPVEADRGVPAGAPVRAVPSDGEARVEEQLRAILRSLGATGLSDDTGAEGPAGGQGQDGDARAAAEPSPDTAGRAGHAESEPAQGAEPPAAAGDDEAQNRLVLGAVQRALGEEDIDRIAAVALSRLSEAETRRRQAAIAHLKAAVAATEADRVLSGDENDAEPSELDRYRDDLSRAVQQAAEPVQPLQRKPATLVLGASLMVVPPEARRAAAPERHGLGEGEAGDAETGAAEISFAQFVDALSPEGLSELLEAAAAYLSVHEKRKHFSRPQIMRKVASVAGETRFSREEGLRSFGALLRQGRLQKLERGQFALAPTSRFRQDIRH